jgi:hypothetical protein
VLLDGQPNLERIKEEMAKAEADAQKPAESAPVAAIQPAVAPEPQPSDSAETQPTDSAGSQQEA